MALSPDLQKLLDALQGKGTTGDNLKKIADHWKAMAESARNLVDANEDISKWTKEQAKAQLEIGRNQEILQQLLKSEAEFQQDLLSNREKIRKEMERLEELGIKGAKKQKEYLKDLVRQRKEVVRLKNLGKTKREETAKEVKKQQQITKELVKQKELTLGGVDMLSKAAGFGKKFDSTWTGAITNIVKGWDNVGGAVEEIFTPEVKAGWLALSFEKQIKSWVTLAFQADELRSSFIKQTGATKDLSDVTNAASKSMRQMGLGMETAYEASAVLMDGITAFQTGTEESQSSLIKWTATLGKAGIDMGAATKVFQAFNKSLGMSPKRAAAATERIIQFARVMKMNVNRALADANALMPTLLAHGEKAEQVFKGMAMTAQQTGISMQNLFNIAKGFDTFEKAASSTAKLNAILGGGYLNSVEMVYATESERLIMLQKTLALSGKNFNQMKRFEKQALANSTGFSSVAEAANFFNNSIEVNTAEMERNAEKQETMRELAERAMPVMEQMRMMFQQMAIDLQPAVTGLGKLVSFFGKIFSAGDGWIGIIAGIALAVWKLGKALMFVAGEQALIGGGAGGAAAATGLAKWAPLLMKGGLLGLGLAAVVGGGILAYNAFSDDDEETPTGFQGGKRATMSLHRGEGVQHRGKMAKVSRPGLFNLPDDATVHTSNATSNFATRDDMASFGNELKEGLSQIAASMGGNQIMLDGEILGRWTKSNVVDPSLQPFNTA